MVALFVLAVIGYCTVSGEEVSRCTGYKFDSLMCHPGTVVRVTSAVASSKHGPKECTTTGAGCEGPVSEQLLTSIKEACDGRLACVDLESQEVNTGCSLRGAEVSRFITIHYDCQIMEDLQYKTTCRDSRFGNIVCSSGEDLHVVNIFAGKQNTACTHGNHDTRQDCLITLDSVSVEKYMRLVNQCQSQAGCSQEIARWYSSSNCITTHDYQTDYVMIVYTCKEANTLSRTCTGSAIGAGCPGDLLMSNLFVRYVAVSGVGDVGQDCQQYLGPDYPQKCYVGVEPEYLSAIEAQCSGRRQCGYILAKGRDIDCFGQTAKSHFVAIQFHCVQGKTSSVFPTRSSVGDVTKHLPYTTVRDVDILDKIRTTPSTDKTVSVIIIATTVSLLVFVIFVVLLVVCLIKRKKKRNTSSVNTNNMNNMPLVSPSNVYSSIQGNPGYTEPRHPQTPNVNTTVSVSQQNVYAEVDNPSGHVPLNDDVYTEVSKDRQHGQSSRQEEGEDTVLVDNSLYGSS